MGGHCKNTEPRGCGEEEGLGVGAGVRSYAGLREKMGVLDAEEGCTFGFAKNSWVCAVISFGGTGVSVVSFAPVLRVRQFALGFVRG